MLLSERSEILLCTLNDVILHVFCQLCEVCAIAGYTNNKVLILFRILLSCDQCGLVHYIKLHFHTFTFKISAYHCCKIHKALIPCQCRRQIFLIIKSTIGSQRMVQFGYRVGCCSRAVHIFARTWGNAICQRGSGDSSTWKSSYIIAVDYIAGYREEGSLEDTAALEALLAGCKRTPEALEKALASTDVSRYFHGLTRAQLVELLCV